jgi:hypothetical protein
MTARPRRDHPTDQARLGHGTSAAKLAPLPATSVVDAARIIPSTDAGVSAATQPGQVLVRVRAAAASPMD